MTTDYKNNNYKTGAILHWNNGDIHQIKQRKHVNFIRNTVY